jgi:disulfide bond formation protein DsbB
MNVRAYFSSIVSFLCLIAVLFALIAQHQFGVKPCILCVYERYLFAALGLMAALLSLYNNIYVKAVTLAVAVSLSALTIYHVGIENKIFPVFEACKASVAAPPPLDLPAQERIRIMKENMAKNKNLVRCDEVTWRIFGVSATLLMLVLTLSFIPLIVLKK